MEKLTWKIWKDPNMGKVLLVGGILYYIPVLNLLLLGYYGLWVRRLVRKEGMELPEWGNGRALLEEFGRVILPAIVWLLLPVLLAGLLVWGLYGILLFLHLGFFAATLAWFPMAVVAVFCPLAMTLALIRLNETGQIQATFAVHEICRTVLRHLRPALFPLFQYFGILILGWPLLGFAAFLGTLPLLAQLILIYRNPEEDLKSAAI